MDVRRLVSRAVHVEVLVMRRGGHTTLKVPLWLCIGTAVCVAICVVKYLSGEMDIASAVVVGFLLTASWASAYDSSEP